MSRKIGFRIKIGSPESSRAHAQVALERFGRRLMDHPVASIAVLLALALIVELAQAWPEWIRGGHAVGEVVRNLTYAVIGAVLFQWLVVKIPEERRQRSAQLGHEMAFQTLITCALGPLGQYRLLLEFIAENLGNSFDDVDAHDQASVWRAAETIGERLPQVIGDPASNHFQILGNAIMGAQVALDGMAASTGFFHPDVAHALGRFPASTGLQQLQVPPPDADLALCVSRSAHIIWNLLEGARRLAAALEEHAPYVNYGADCQTEIVIGGKTRTCVGSRTDLIRETSHDRMADTATSV